ncbi:uncharacterized protein K452DRAFT_318581 [Aplosporella prunicola CBS 121167]|uniref:Mid2 domain-containing protein n=1 Tax=Aplosporella prunicola CBS 121167 TaxID=1176127 RepID=A0A6A6BDX3_9PEZI|nr:uncharacterized protein K452DRAFT_318581 [Aplosporella prunicola CBS 121167]KAF2141593.1 hypothetical protein K452DRAFT_318581 [Aplosporella prunicola CBS 121167]
MRSSQLLSLALLWASALGAKCYWPDGSQAINSYICNTTAVDNGGYSGCCLKNDICYSDGSCAQAMTNIPYRLTCTDKDWQDDACPKMCLSAGSKNNSVLWIQRCFPRSRKSCCLTDSPSCCNEDPPAGDFFKYEPGLVTAFLDDDGNDRLSASQSAAATASSSLNAAAKSSASSDNTGKNAAIALGVVLGVILIASAASTAFLWKKYKAESHLRSVAESKLLLPHENPRGGGGSGKPYIAAELPNADREIREMPS